mgnify:CR=1 FL=1
MMASYVTDGFCLQENKMKTNKTGTEILYIIIDLNSVKLGRMCQVLYFIKCGNKVSATSSFKEKQGFVP